MVKSIKRGVKLSIVLEHYYREKQNDLHKLIKDESALCYYIKKNIKTVNRLVDYLYESEEKHLSRVSILKEKGISEYDILCHVYTSCTSELYIKLFFEVLYMERKDIVMPYYAFYIGCIKEEKYREFYISSKNFVEDTYVYLDRLVYTLDKKELDIVYRVLLGESRKSIAESYNVSNTTIVNLYNRALNRIKYSIFDEIIYKDTKEGIYSLKELQLMERDDLKRVWDCSLRELDLTQETISILHKNDIVRVSQLLDSKFKVSTINGLSNKSYIEIFKQLKEKGIDLT